MVECLYYIYDLHVRGMRVCGTTYVWRHSGHAFFRFAKSWFIDTPFIAASSGTFGNIFDFKFQAGAGVLANCLISGSGFEEF